MTRKLVASLKELQRLDLAIEQARTRITEFEPLLETVEEPAAQLREQVEGLRSRLKEMKLDERRLELTANERRTRMKALQERLNTVRNLREEAAVHAELDLVRRALEADEQEALTLLDQIRQGEMALDEAEKRLAEAENELEPKRRELLDQREAVEGQLTELSSERERFAAGLEVSELRVYDSIKVGKRSVVVAELTPDGACGHCFSVVPLQIQNEIRHGARMIRCEACGVILTVGEGGGPG